MLTGNSSLPWRRRTNICRCIAMEEEAPDNPYGFLPVMTRDEIYALPLRQFGGDIRLVDSLSGLERNLTFFSANKLVGFDTESKPSFKKGQRNKVALIQLSNSQTAILVRLNKLGMHEELIQFLTNFQVIKIGVALKDDLNGLKQLKSFTPAGFIDLQTYVKEFGIAANSLRTLAAIVLGFRISKSQQVTNWDAQKLSDSQQVYAATDAWVCYEIYQKLEKLKSELSANIRNSCR